MMRKGMPAITLWQPYATLLVRGVKRHETRSWTMPQSLHGRRTAIHAAKRPVSKADEDRLRRIGLQADDMPLGCLVGWVEFQHCIEVGGVLSAGRRGHGRMGRLHRRTLGVACERQMRACQSLALQGQAGCLARRLNWWVAVYIISRMTRPYRAEIVKE